MLEMVNVRKYFSTPQGRFAALDDVSFKVAEGEFVSVVGPSGCGKSTVLNIVAGLTPPDEGQVLVKGQVVRDVSRVMGYTFQQSTLLPWRTVRDNVGLGLELRGVAEADRKPTVDRLIEQVGLTQFADAHPHQLSGGMAKRAEIARVLAIDPEILLMDEDAQTRVAMHTHLNLKKTVLFITHDLEEALILSDRVITMRARPGRIRGEHVIPLERPRDARRARTDRRFPDVLLAIWDDIEPSSTPEGAHP